MTGRDGTALRSLAAVAQAISVLSGATYVGDLPNSGWRVFNTTGDGLVAVVSSGRPVSPNATMPNPVWSWYYPVRKLEGIDGRFLNVHCGASGCQYENEDGLMYAYLSDLAIHALQRHTTAAQLTALARPPAPATAARRPLGKKAPPLPFVLRYEWDESQVEVLSGDAIAGSQWGYRLILSTTTNFTAFDFAVSLHSLSPDTTAPAAATTMTLRVGQVDAAPKSVQKTIAPMGVASVRWSALDLSAHATGPAALVELAVSAEPAASSEVRPRHMTTSITQAASCILCSCPASGSVQLFRSRRAPGSSRCHSGSASTSGSGAACPRTQSRQITFAHSLPKRFAGSLRVCMCFRLRSICGRKDNRPELRPPPPSLPPTRRSHRAIDRHLRQFKTCL